MLRLVSVFAAGIMLAGSIRAEPALQAAPTQAPAQPPSAGPRPLNRPDPLEPLVREALRVNLGLAQERLEERRSAAEEGEARALLLPTLSLESRYSHIEGGLNMGDLINPAYSALNQLTGTK